MERKIMPTTWFLGFLTLIIILHFLIVEKKMIFFPYNQFGWIFVLSDIILNLWTDNLFKKYKTTVKPYLKPSYFISNGPFRISRNPMYFGMLLILLGTTVLLKSVVLLIIPFAYLCIIHIFYIRKEEQKMLLQFGIEYSKYKKKVRSWI